MSGYERIGFEKTLAFHTAPTLMGLKCSNLISVSLTEDSIAPYRTEFERRSGTKMKVLCQCRGKQLILVYRERELKKLLAQPQIMRFLRQYGYFDAMTLDEKLHHLAGRISCESFPHEIGIFLGYPLADVQGFIRNQGKNCLLCGCWKVYSDPDSARQTFAEYTKCRDILCKNLQQGFGFFKALEISKEEFS